MKLPIIIAITTAFAIVCIYLAYMFIQHFDPDEPDEVQFRRHLPVLVHLDSQIIPIMTVAQHVDTQYYVENAEIVEDLCEIDIENPVVVPATENSQ